jgi:hypothetical protein
MRPTHLLIPPSGVPGTYGQYDTVAAPSSIVIVGANGAGKSRLGAWMEFDGPQTHLIRRVGAQRSIRMLDEIMPRTVEYAEAALKYGLSAAHANTDYIKSILENPQHDVHYRKQHRWSGDPIVGMLSDFDPLLGVLFSEHTEAAIRFMESSRLHPAEPQVTPVPETRLDRVKRVWERALPYRTLELRGSTVEARPADGAATYKASAMSDGERVAFYLIAYCLTAPPGSIVVIDEPELHLHRAVQAQLWNEIERERGDCLFVYITHDLDFAASRVGAVKLWFSSYGDGVWRWELIPDAAGLPEEVLLTVLGSRKPVLFVEGDRGSLEQAILARVYPGWTVVPRGGHEAVIGATSAFRALSDRHRFECRGIIDRDYRSDEAISSLAASGIDVLAVHEIENLLLVEDALRAVAKHQALDDPEAVVNRVKEWVFAELAADKQRTASAAAAYGIEEALRSFDAKAQGEEALRGAVERLTTGVDVAALYAEAANRIDETFARRDYARALQLYSNKGLVREVDRFFGLGGGGYVQLVKRLLARAEGDELLRALAAAAPQIPVPAPAGRTG